MGWGGETNELKKIQQARRNHLSLENLSDVNDKKESILKLVGDSKCRFMTMTLII